MAVEKYDFEGCCTADILTNFGQSRTSEYGNHAVTYPKLREQVVAKVNIVKGRHGIVTAILTNEQTTAAKVLTDLGFTGTGWAEKNAHSEVNIQLYYLHCKGWVEPELPEEENRPVEAPVAAPQPFAAARNPAPQVNRNVPIRDAQGRFAAQAAAPVLYKAVSPFNGRDITYISWRGTFSTAPHQGPVKTFTEEQMRDLRDLRERTALAPLQFQQI